MDRSVYAKSLADESDIFCENNKAGQTLYMQNKRKGWMNVGEMSTLRINLRSHLCRVVCFRRQRSLAVVTIKVYNL